MSTIINGFKTYHFLYKYLKISVLSVFLFVFFQITLIHLTRSTKSLIGGGRFQAPVNYLSYESKEIYMGFGPFFGSDACRAIWYRAAKKIILGKR